MPQQNRSQLVCITGEAAIDASGTCVAPAAMLLEVQIEDRTRWPEAVVPDSVAWGKATLLALDRPEQITTLPGAAAARRMERPGCVLLPGLVNAHTHLDLTHIGPQPFDQAQGFLGFIRLVLAQRLTDPKEIRTAVLEGARRSLRGGVTLVGDVSGIASGLPSLEPWHALRASGLGGVSFLEYLAIGTQEASGVRAVRDALALGLSQEREVGGGNERVRLGISPHAPYTVGLGAFSLADGHLARMTHLAETIEERQCIAEGRGPFAEFLQRVGWWNETLAASLGHGRTPVEHLRTVLQAGEAGTSAHPWLLAHVNDASDADIALLARAGAAVAYCPRGSAYFLNHEHFGPHRYRDMLAAGVNVCLGTDSIINLPEGTQRLSTLDEARYLFARDETDPLTLLAMATTHGARALGGTQCAKRFRFRAGDHSTTLAGVVAVPIERSAGPSPLEARAESWMERVLRDRGNPELLVLGTGVLHK